jgi:tetratricopeptide (TPR) repeat protein
MKQTIFRLTYAGLLIAAFLACGAAASFAQDPCTDVASLNAKQDEYDKLWAGRNDTDPSKAVANRKAAINSGKEFIDKFGSCDSAKERVAWLQTNLPKQDATVKQMESQMQTGAVLKSFDAALQASGSADATAKAKAYDDVYNIGGQILTQWPEKYRTAEIILATIGGDEALLRNNYKYSDNALRYAKMAIADLEANKGFAVGGEGADKFGLGMKDSSGKIVYNYSFADRNEANGWMNLYVGYILYNNKKDKAGALPYLYKASKLIPKDAPVAFSLIGDYYFDQLAPAVTEINDLIKKNQTETNADTIKATNEQIKAKIALSNGIAERAMDAYARAYTTSTKADYKANMKGRIDQIFKVRFPTPPVSLDQWIASAVAKPFVDPSTPVTPIADQEPAKTTSGEATTTPATTAPAKTQTPTTTAPAKTQTPAKPAGTTTAKKPGVAATKTVAKKRGA